MIKDYSKSKIFKDVLILVNILSSTSIYLRNFILIISKQSLKYIDCVLI
jgi:hypothetical protein